MKNLNKFPLFLICLGILLVITACTGPKPTSAPGEAPPTDPPAEAAPPTDPPAEEEAEPATEEPTDTPPTATPTPAPPPTATPTPEAEPFYEEDFSDPNSGWERYNEFDGILDYEDDGYRMWVQPANTFFVWIEDQPADVRIEVDAKKQAGPDDNHFGLICRLDRGGTWDYYMFLITSEGKYGIAKSSRAEGTIWLGTAKLTPSDAVKLGNEVNHIRADCVGDMLTLYVNGQKLLETQDSSLPGGDMGLVAGSDEEGGVDILFDDFKLYEP